MAAAIIFTTAPDAYDLPGTRPLCPHVGFTAEGLVIRAVEIDLGIAVEQARRYLGAGFVATDHAGLREIVRAGGYIEPAILIELERIPLNGPPGSAIISGDSADR